MKDVFQLIWGLVILAGVAMWMGWIDTPKPLMAMIDRANGNDPDAFGGLKARMPENQSLFVGVVELARDKYLSGSNDLAKGSARISRKEELCAVVGTSTEGEWVGVVETLSTNGDGLGVLSVKIAPHITVSTWNNSLSDVGSDTLIAPSSQVYKIALGLKEGDLVRFSGTFFPSNNDCISEQSVTLEGSMEDPEFTIKFESLSAA